MSKFPLKMPNVMIIQYDSEIAYYTVVSYIVMIMIVKGIINICRRKYY